MRDYWSRGATHLAVRIPLPSGLEVVAPGGTCPLPGDLCCSSFWLRVLYA